MGNTNKESPSYRASVVLRTFARDATNQRVANVVRMIDSRLRYFMDGENTAQEGEISHLTWAWDVQTELRDLNYLGLVPDMVCSQVYDLLEEAVCHSQEVYRKRNERIHLRL